MSIESSQKLKSEKVLRFSFSLGTQVMETLGSTVRYLQEVPLSLLTRSETALLYIGAFRTCDVMDTWVEGGVGVVTVGLWGGSRG